jgi:transposase
MKLLFYRKSKRESSKEPIPKVVESDESFVIPCAAPESSTGGAEMWKPEHRRAAVRHGLRYPSDLTDAEWVLVEPMIPPAKRGGRRREVNVREVLNAIFYVLSTGCQWQALPKDLPPKSTAHSYFMLWDWDGTLERIHHALYVAVREQEGREASPTVAIIDSQTAKGAQKGGFRSILRATTRARRSRVASGTSWLIRWVCC